MRKSQRYLANLLNVSPMTVSRVLRGKEGVSGEIRERIINAARQHGLAIPQAGIRMAESGPDRRRMPAQVLCLMVPFSISPQGGLSLLPFFGRIVKGALEMGRELRKEVLLCEDSSATAWPLPVARSQVDGVIRMHPMLRSFDSPARSPVPAVMLFFEDNEAELVGINDFGGGRLLGGYLAKQGHRCVAFIGRKSPLCTERLAGWRSALEEAGGRIPDEMVFFIPARADLAAIRTVAETFVERCIRAPSGNGGARCTACAVYNDVIAVTVRDVLLEHGVRIPEEMSLVGFDGALPEGCPDFGLTTALVPLEEIGREAVRLLYWRLETPEAPRRRLTLDVQLREGATVAPVNMKGVPS